MKGIWSMLSGRGEKEYRQQHEEFDNSIPNKYPFRAGEYVRYGPGELDYRNATPADASLPEHPAYSGRYGKTMDASNYRKANSAGPKSKQHHAWLSQKLVAYEKKYRVVTHVQDPQFLAWVDEQG
jgi:hypothetical protein